VWDAVTGEPAAIAREPAAASHVHMTTASTDEAVRPSDVEPVPDTLEHWAAVAARSPFVLDEGGALVRSKRRTQ
jgi:hypothetical protein